LRNASQIVIVETTTLAKMPMTSVCPVTWKFKAVAPTASRQTVLNPCNITLAK
jgi:hypothetical protein